MHLAWNTNYWNCHTAAGLPLKQQEKQLKLIETTRDWLVAAQYNQNKTIGHPEDNTTNNQNRHLTIKFDNKPNKIATKELETRE